MKQHFPTVSSGGEVGPFLTLSNLPQFNQKKHIGIFVPHWHRLQRPHDPQCEPAVHDWNGKERKLRQVG